MYLFTTVAGLRCYLESQKNRWCAEASDSRLSGSNTIGFVPTMGALHSGHLSLIQRAREETTIVVVSIFVNPLQFGPNEDFQNYPRNFEADQQLCEQAGVDVLFMPTAGELGLRQPVLTQVVPPTSLLEGLCGRSRPGHFQGVATIVTKLLNLVQPDRAYFGQKDAQQLVIIQKLVADLNLPVEIIGCPIIREANGLACSSRNQYLSTTQRDRAATLQHSLQLAAQAFHGGVRQAEMLLAIVRQELATIPDLEPDYVELVDPVTLTTLTQVEESGLLAIAVRLGTIRLIDNLTLRNRRPIIAIDGPAGAGKSTVTRLVAAKLGLLRLDTGAMYRAVTWLVLQAKVPVDDEPAIAELVSRCNIEFQDVSQTPLTQAEGLTVSASTTVAVLAEAVTTVNQPRILMNGQDVTEVIRTQEVTANVSAISAHASVRRMLVQLQQAYGRRGGLVAEGRDIGTQVFPDAELKIFLTASTQERARRRQQELKTQQGKEVSLDHLAESISQRDRMDSTRKVSPLRKAGDAIEVQTDGLGIPEVVDIIIAHYHRILGG